MENYNLVSYSRAGDVFHYRWAARRCLNLLNFNSSLSSIVIEGSKEKIGGEYIIDVSEYYSDEDEYNVKYYQLKHSVTQLDKPFTLSLLKDTFIGFAERYKAIKKKDAKFKEIKFYIVTNRPVSANFKNSVENLSKDESVDNKFKNTIKKYTKLKNNELKEFCLSINFMDGEGNYDEQKFEIHKDLSKLTSVIDTSVIDRLVGLVQEKAVDINDKTITREDVLKQFGVSAEKELFPCESEFEDVSGYVLREQHGKLKKEIVESKNPIIISASGGVGKTVVCCQLVADFKKDGSYAVAYDCFANGKYRRTSEKRHQASNSFIQITNELAREGLCEPIIPQSYDQDDRLMRTFLDRLKSSVENLRNLNKTATLIIMVDAADNAEMAAEEFGENCFANQLLNEDIPEGCRLVMFARPERIKLLKPNSNIERLFLLPFSEKETLCFLKQYFPDVTESDGIEFRRLTDGNPRVQANALDIGLETVNDVLSSLGPSGTSVDDLIEAQLSNAVAKIKDALPTNFQQQVDDICSGLANLPPFVPLKVLSAAANVEIDTVKSFVADLGRPLWLTDNAIQFRDEPTETWFRNQFAASTDQVKRYVTKLKPLANESPYVSEALPSLLLRAGLYEELLSLSLSDDLLPDDSPIDSRNIRVYRLQFSFKAALKQKKYFDAAKIAFRAGEEVAGDSRQLQILSENIDLIVPLQSNERVEELAHKRMICGSWDGSENVYSASLLSNLNEYKGEARGYFRAAERWLQLYFEERDKKKRGEQYIRGDLECEDILEMVFTVLNLYGSKSAVEYMLSWHPELTIFQVAQLFSRKLVDKAKFSLLDEILHYGINSPVFVIAITHELIKVGRVPDKKILTRSLNKIINKKTRIDKPRPFYERGISANVIASFLEACVIKKLLGKNIKRALNYYLGTPRIHSIADNYYNDDRIIFMQSLAINAALSGKFDESVDNLIPKTWEQKTENYEDEREFKEAKEAMSILLPWYMVRARILSGEKVKLSDAHAKAQNQISNILRNRYREYDVLLYEITNIRFANVILNNRKDEGELNYFLSKLKNEKNDFRLVDRIEALRACYRLEHMGEYRDELEASCYEAVSVVDDEGPEEHARWFIKLARAVLPLNPNDAKAYFDCAIEAVSRFGDELIERWEAVSSIAYYTGQGGLGSPELSYRFMRCAELIGDNVREKHFDRNGAVKACFSLCPNSTFSILSRWKDRHVGWSDRQIPVLAYESVTSGMINPSAGWSLTAFSWEYHIYQFTSLCLNKESNKLRQQAILDYLVRDLRCRGVTGDIWNHINVLCKKYKLDSKELNNLEILALNKNAYQSRSHETYHGELVEDNKHNWNSLLENFDLSNSQGISQAISVFDNLPHPKEFNEFWKWVFNQITANNSSQFLIALANAEEADLYDINQAIAQFPSAWKTKPSVRIAWLKFSKLIGKRFASQLTVEYRREQLLEVVGKLEEVITAIDQGILEGLAEFSNLHSASTFYGFARTSISLISTQEASELLDYSLLRFELHVQSEYADGEWDEWMQPPTDSIKSFTGYIWSSLGAPKTSERWRATHAVRRLYELGCQSEIDALLDWMMNKEIGAFGCKDYPFYYLHAKQYLLIALLRSAIDSVELLKAHKNLFLKIATEEKHILIQTYAAKIALTIEALYPGSYSLQEIQNIKAAISSPFSLKYLDKYAERKQFDIPWHTNGEIAQFNDYTLSYDFDRYWFEPLSQVFNASNNQLQALAKQVIRQEWGSQLADGYKSEPRQYLWKSNRMDRETWHSHGGYPAVDNYRFYLSYHAMLVVATKLLQAMPIIHDREWREDEWGEWLQRHNLTRADSKWLSDRRDPIPLERRDWVDENKDESWRWQITSDDFIEALFMERKGETWLCVAGNWNECIDGYDEDFYIKSMLVSISSSQSLMNAIMMSEDPRGYGLINFIESDFDNSNEKPFQLKKWIHRDQLSKYLDEHDPYAGDIDYPPYVVDDSIINEFTLTSDTESRYWYQENSENLSLVTQIWSEDKKTGERESYIRRGHRMYASLSFLVDLCINRQSDLIFEIQINRKLTSSYSRREENDIGYTPPYRQIYVLSKNGKLRDTRKSYHLRKKVS